MKWIINGLALIYIHAAMRSNFDGILIFSRVSSILWRNGKLEGGVGGPLTRL